MKLLLLLLLIVSGSYAFTQESFSGAMQSERLSLKNSGANYSSYEQELAFNGVAVPALVSRQENAGEVSFSFKTYKNIRPERADAIRGRLMMLCPSIVSLAFDGSDVDVTFGAAAPESELSEFFRILGYAGGFETGL